MAKEIISVHDGSGALIAIVAPDDIFTTEDTLTGLSAFLPKDWTTKVHPLHSLGSLSQELALRSATSKR